MCFHLKYLKIFLLFFEFLHQKNEKKATIVLIIFQLLQVFFFVFQRLSGSKNIYLHFYPKILLYWIKGIEMFHNFKKGVKLDR